MLINGNRSDNNFCIMQTAANKLQIEGEDAFI